jgi:hypothetical protein
LNAIQADVVAVLLDVARDQLELAAQLFELGGDALQQPINLGVRTPRRLRGGRISALLHGSE